MRRSLNLRMVFTKAIVCTTVQQGFIVLYQLLFQRVSDALAVRTDISSFIPQRSSTKKGFIWYFRMWSGVGPMSVSRRH